MAKDMGTFEASVDLKGAVETRAAVSFLKTSNVDLSHKKCHQ
jgi:hypothetical protein